MGRTKRFVSALSSGYLALAANGLYTFLSVPLALHYLSREEFGLWAVVAQMSGYLTLVDFGIGQSVSRILIDYKDDVNGGEYGAVIKTASIIFVGQAITILFLGAIGGRLCADILQIPEKLRYGFQMLMMMQCSIIALNFAMTPFWIPLWSHQRSDIANFASIGIFLANGVSLWIAFELGLRYYSLVAANLVGTVVYLSITTFATLKLGLLPSFDKWGKISSAKFWEIFNFSRDLFLLQVATQFISASQIVLVSRLIGLDAAGVWSVCTKCFTLAQQIVSKIYDFSVPGFSEMVVRAEFSRFRERLSTIVSVTAVGAGLFAVLGAFGNRTLVSFWTGGKMMWDQWVDICAASYLLFACVTRCYTGVTGVVKRIGNFKYVILSEGLLVVFGSILLVPRLQFVGIFLAAIFANLVCSGLYGVSLVAHRFGTNVADVTIGWLRSALGFVVIFSGFAALIFRIGGPIHGFRPFALTAAFAGVTGLTLALFIGLQQKDRKEMVLFVRRLVQNARIPVARSNSGARTIESDLAVSADADSKSLLNIHDRKTD